MRRLLGHTLNRALGTVFVCAIAALPITALAAGGKPNILVIWGDDIGQSNIPRMKPGSFSIDKVMEKMSAPGEH